MAKILNNPILNDFIYTLLYGASIEEKRGLPIKYRKIAMNGRAAKKFATTSTREEKEFILTHFGMEYFYVIARRGMALAKFREILDKFEKKKKVSALADIAEEMVFVTSDKEFIRLLGLMSQSIHHPSYFMNMELSRQGYHIQRWSKATVNQEDKAMREQDMTAKLVVKTCLSACLLMDFWPGTTGISPEQQKILLFLYTVSHTYVSDDRLYAIFAGSIPKNRYRAAVKQLTDSELILRHATAKETEFAISGSGMKRVNEYIHRVLNLNTF